MADEYNNYELKAVKAHHFTGPLSEIGNDFRTVPDLLRSVADWMDANNIQDPEAEALMLKCSFEDNGDDFHETITLYYLDNPQPRGTK